MLIKVSVQEKMGPLKFTKSYKLSFLFTIYIHTTQNQFIFILFICLLITKNVGL